MSPESYLVPGESAEAVKNNYNVAELQHSRAQVHLTRSQVLSAKVRKNQVPGIDRPMDGPPWATNSKSAPLGARIGEDRKKVMTAYRGS